MIRKVNLNWNWSGHLEGELNFYFGDEMNNTAEDKIAARREEKKKTKLATAWINPAVSPHLSESNLWKWSCWLPLIRLCCWRQTEALGHISLISNSVTKGDRFPSSSSTDGIKMLD